MSYAVSARNINCGKGGTPALLDYTISLKNMRRKRGSRGEEEHSKTINLCG